VVQLGNEELTSDALVKGCVDVADLLELLLDGPEEGDSQLDLVKSD